MRAVRADVSDLNEGRWRDLILRIEAVLLHGGRSEDGSGQVERQLRGLGARNEGRVIGRERGRRGSPGILKRSRRREGGGIGLSDLEGLIADELISIVGGG